MSNAIIKGEERPATQIQTVARDYAQRLRYMIVNGAKLAEPEVFALAQYAAATLLDPFSGECWYIPGKGPCPGIAGWRKKAQEQLEYEAEHSGVKEGAHYWVEFYPAGENDCKFDAARGDIAFVAHLRDYLTQKRWRNDVFVAAKEIMSLDPGKVPYSEAMAIAREMVGKEPLVIGAGVVFAGENFGGNDKFDRFERCKKRAEKAALRKRFPRIHLPEPEGVDDVVDSGDYKIVMEEEEPKKKLTAADTTQIIKELGFEVEEPVAEAEYANVPTHHETTEKSEQTRPYNPEYLRSRIINGAAKYKKDATRITPVERQITAVGMTNLFAGLEGAAGYGQSVLKFLSGTDDHTALEDEWMVAVKNWLQVREVDGEPMPSSHACEEGMKIIEYLQSK